jgi:hypothetical protein
VTSANVGDELATTAAKLIKIQGFMGDLPKRGKEREGTAS